MKRLVVAVAIVAAVLAAARGMLAEPDGLPELAERLADGTHVTSAPARAAQALGGATASAIRPVVVGMTVKTERQVGALEPDIGRAPALRAKQARSLAAQIAETDSAALYQLSEGRPIADVKLAMKARSMVPALRSHLLEERIR
jgi:hypothetical protein